MGTNGPDEATPKPATPAIHSGVPESASPPSAAQRPEPPAWQQTIGCLDVLGRERTVSVLILICREHPVVVHVPAGEVAYLTTVQASRLVELIRAACARVS